MRLLSLFPSCPSSSASVNTLHRSMLDFTDVHLFFAVFLLLWYLLFAILIYSLDFSLLIVSFRMALSYFCVIFVPSTCILLSWIFSANRLTVGSNSDVLCAIILCTKNSNASYASICDFKGSFMQ